MSWTFQFQPFDKAPWWLFPKDLLLGQNEVTWGIHSVQWSCCTVLQLWFLLCDSWWEWPGRTWWNDLLSPAHVCNCLMMFLLRGSPCRPIPTVDWWWCWQAGLCFQLLSFSNSVDTVYTSFQHHVPPETFSDQWGCSVSTWVADIIAESSQGTTDKSWRKYQLSLHFSINCGFLM